MNISQLVYPFIYGHLCCFMFGLSLNFHGYLCIGICVDLCFYIFGKVMGIGLLNCKHMFTLVRKCMPYPFKYLISPWEFFFSFSLRKFLYFFPDGRFPKHPFLTNTSLSVLQYTCIAWKTPICTWIYFWISPLFYYWSDDADRGRR